MSFKKESSLDFLEDNTLFVYQKRVIKRLISCNHGLIAYHTMGSGKTLIALKTLALFKGKKIILCPASTIQNYYKEASIYSISIDNETEILSYEYFLKHINMYKNIQISLLICDEAHRLRNKDTRTYTDIKKICGNAEKILMLTGTAEYNQPSDICNLINLIDPKKNCPNTLSKFCRRYIEPSSGELKRKEELKSLLKEFVDFNPTITEENRLPRVTTKLIKVPMSETQYRLYKYVLKKLPFLLRRAVSNNIPLSLPSTALINLYSTAARQVSLSTIRYDINYRIEDCPKLLTAINNLLINSQKERFRAIVYSNYIQSGLLPYKSILEKKGITPLLFIGSVSQKEKHRIVELYNSNNDSPIILLISSSGGEGLDLKGTRLIQILEPHFNLSKINQVKARGIRLDSHESLPENEHEVLIEEYFSILPVSKISRFFGIKTKTSIDEYLYESSIRKQKIIQKIIELMK